MNEQQASAATCCRWESTTRYYVGLVQTNLFGQWELVRMWGGRGSFRGGCLVQPAGSEAEAIDMLRAESKRRRSRGYTAVVSEASGRQHP